MRTSILVGCLLLILPIHSIRSRRYAIEGSFWGVKRVTYKFATPCSSLSLGQLERIFRRAFEVWEERTGLIFAYSPGAEAHIDITFASGSHGDGEPFDGRGRILAHAFFPRYGGDLHFDDDELWSDEKNGPGLDLYAVAVHEIGHALGLKHTHEPAAIMAPFYHTSTGDRLHLHADDLSAIDRLYGHSGAANRKMAVVHATRQEKPDICSTVARIDAITQVSNGSVYAFQGEFFWRLESNGPVEGFPLRIEDVWGMGGSVDAAVTNSNGHTYIFKGTEYYVFDKDCRPLDGYPKKISKGLVDTPEHLSAATSLDEDGQPYFFKGDRYWKYSRWGMGSEWPRRINELLKGKKAPKRIDAAVNLRGKGTFLFSGDRYWQVSGKRQKRGSYPRSTAEDWFKCPRSQVKRFL